MIIYSIKKKTELTDTFYMGTVTRTLRVKRTWVKHYLVCEKNSVP